MPVTIFVHVFPKSFVLYAYGATSSILLRLAATYTVPASNGDGATMPILDHSFWGYCFNSGGVTSVHVVPLSRVIWTRPSSVPTQMRPFCFGDSAMQKMVS